MIAPKIQWVSRTEFRETIEAYAGRWKVGRIFRDADAKPKRPYAAQVIMPGLNPDQGHYATVEEAKEQLTRILGLWFNDLTKKPQIHRSYR